MVLGKWKVEAKKKWYIEHREERLKIQRECYKRNKEVYRKKGRDKYHNNPEKCKEYQRRHNKEEKMIVLSHYSPEIKCIKCGFSDIKALEIDHINGGGNKQRKLIGCGSKFYRWLIKNNFPNGFQVLCANCNRIKQIENYES